jgi:uncharacterized membrane protein (UPF0182 family)
MRGDDLGADDLTVLEAAEALGTTPQTVRALLRKGELRGRKRAWGSRYVWVPSREGVEAFLAEHGRLEGHPRRRAPAVALEGTGPSAPGQHPAQVVTEPDRAARPFVLRVRGRATVVVVVLGVPLVAAYVWARLLPGALWFDELGQPDVFRGILRAKAEFYLLVAGTVAVFIGVNLGVAARPTANVPRRTRALGIAAASLVTGSLFATAVEGHWQTFLLWRHGQAFGVADPIYGKDVGFFVFSLPLALVISGLLLWLVAVAWFYVALVYNARGLLHFRPLRVTFSAEVHLSVLTAVFLLSLAWRLRLDRYRLELGQPSPHDSDSFAGADFVDFQVRLPGLTALTSAAVVLAVACVAAPFVARSGRVRGARLIVGVPGALLFLAVVLVGAAVPALVQRFVVDPSPLLREKPFLERSIGSTRLGLGLDTIVAENYTPTGSVNPADFPTVRKRLAEVPIWDRWLLEARMRQLVTETPYFSPEDPVLDIVRADGRRQLTIVSARELDLDPVRGNAATWFNDRLAYTHGLGLIRFSATDVEQGREPRLMDPGLGVDEPRIYFGQPQRAQADAVADGGAADASNAQGDEEGEEAPRNTVPAATSRTAGSSWVLADTRRPEVDIAGGVPRAAYHYEGTGGVELSSRFRRAAFAVALGRKELLLSDDITSESRVLLHRDVTDRLQTLAPFIQWDSHAVPLTANGRVVFAVDGYTTSRSYPDAQLMDLGGVKVNYARATVRATVDAFSGQVEIYLVDPSEPIARAWAETFPTLFRVYDELPSNLRERLRYPADLFAAQATAYERFHTTRPDQFVSEADTWSRPIALSGPIEVAGGVDFDESDEDDLRLIMEPDYTFASPPGQTTKRLLLATYYVPRSGQNLVASLSGWIDENGRARLAARSLPRSPIILGPAQMSRLIFSTPRVTSLLGLRNLEIRDVDKSSLDSVFLGRPHLLFLPGGVVQVQSLYEGSRGPGAARLLGVTAYLDGRAGLGPDIESAVRQALNAPPLVKLLPPEEPIVIGTATRLAFSVQNARKEVVTITSEAGRHRKTLDIVTGQGTVTWVPSVAGEARVRLEVVGLDGTRVAASSVLRVLDHPPTVRLTQTPKPAVVGQPVRILFRLKNALSASATISNRTGIVFSRDYLIRDGVGVLEWTPRQAGVAVLRIQARGHQGQVARTRLRIDVAPGPMAPLPPTLTLLKVPDVATVGRASDITFRADNCLDAVARIEGPAGEVLEWRFPCPVRDTTFSWTPTTPGTYRLTLIARGDGVTTQVSTTLTAEPAP